MGCRGQIVWCGSAWTCDLDAHPVGPHETVVTHHGRRTLVRWETIDLDLGELEQSATEAADA